MFIGSVGIAGFIGFMQLIGFRVWGIGPPI